jgi:hypothetical protein
MGPHDFFSWLFLNSFYLLPFLLSISLVLPSLTRSTTDSAQLSLLGSRLALQQPRCAIRGNIDYVVRSTLPRYLEARVLAQKTDEAIAALSEALQDVRAKQEIP